MAQELEQELGKREPLERLVRRCAGVSWRVALFVLCSHRSAGDVQIKSSVSKENSTYYLNRRSRNRSHDSYYYITPDLSLSWSVPNSATRHNEDDHYYQQPFAPPRDDCLSLTLEAEEH